MKVLKAIGFSIVIYFLSLLIGIMAGNVLGFDFILGGIVPDSLWYLGVLFVIIIAVVSSWLYFSSRKTKPSTKEGFLFGIFVIGFAFILQALMYLFSIIYTRYPITVETYSNEPLLLALMIVFVVTTTFVTWIKKYFK